MSDLTNISGSVYEGTSPAKGDKRRFLKLPTGLTEQDTISFMEGFFAGKKLEGWALTAHMNSDVTEKNEMIDGEQYVRLLLSADPAVIQEKEKIALGVLEQYRMERGFGGEMKR